MTDALRAAAGDNCATRQPCILCLFGILNRQLSGSDQ